MKITSIEARLVRIPLKKVIKHASHSRTETDNLIVRIVLDDGSVGHGEGVPREYVTGESAESGLAMLQATDFASQCGDWKTFEEAARGIELFEVPQTPGDDRQCRGNAARAAVEIALLDAYGRAFKTPLSEVTKLLAPSLFEPKSQVRYSGAITSANGFKAKLAGWKMRLYGFKQVKVKVGIDGQNDVERLKAIRSRLGSKIDVRIDANEAWSVEETAARVAELEPFGITSIEQPVPHEYIAGLAIVRKQMQTPIMFDESLCSKIDGQRAIDGGLCDLFNIRLSKCGGFIPSLRLAELALQHGLGYQLGCQVGETAILSAAGRHFASSVKAIRYWEGSYDHHLVKEALGTKDITFGYGGKAPALIGPGLGIEIDPVALDRVTIRKEVLLAR